jgi:hypothetical protein
MTPAPASPPPIVESIAPSPEPLSLTVLPPEYVPSSSLRSLGPRFVLTQGNGSAADIWPSSQGEIAGARVREPSPGFRHHRSRQNDVAYAFVEANDAAYGGTGAGGSWYHTRSAQGDTAIELPGSHTWQPGVPPSIALDNRRWCGPATTSPRTMYFSFLRSSPVEDLATVDTILRVPIEDALFRTPVLDGDDVWYVAVDADFKLTGVGDESHIEWIDLGSGASHAARFGRHGRRCRCRRDLPATVDRKTAWSLASRI